MNPHDAQPSPVDNEDVEEFAATFTDGLDGQDVDDGVSFVVAADRRDGYLDVALLDASTTESVAVIDQVTSGRPRILGAASRVAWSPTRHGESSSAWLVVVVGAGQPVFAAVRRKQDTQWRLLSPDQLPWFALSTAAALRGVVENHKPLRLKAATNPGLFRRPDEGEPPLDEHGDV